MRTRIYLTGRIAVEVGSEIALSEEQFRARQERLVFAYLACHRGKAVSRDELTGVVWPVERPLAWEAGISALLSRTKRLLSTETMESAGVRFLTAPGQFELDLDGDVWVDVEEAASAVDRAEGALRTGSPRSAFGPASVAASIARRPFLAADSSPWAEQQRLRLQRQLVRALECLAAVWLATSEPTLAAEAATDALALEPLRESAWRLLMRAHIASGNPAHAVSSYHRLRAALDEQMGIAPAKETEDLFLSVLR